MENKIKHMEFIQNIITRMNTNSFQVKGLSITITSAILALIINNYDFKLAAILYFNLFIFWGLDAYYLSQEKMYRNLYTEVANKEESKIDFNLKIRPHHHNNSSWQYCLFNKTIIPIYVTQIIICLIIMSMF